MTRRFLFAASFALVPIACGRSSIDTEEFSFVAQDRAPARPSSTPDAGASTSPADAGTRPDATPPPPDAAADAPIDTKDAAPIDAPDDAPVDAPFDAPPTEIPCSVFSFGDPLMAVTYPDSPAGAPRLAVLNGDGAAPAKLAIGTLKEEANTWHPEYRAVRALVGEGWPQGFGLEGENVVFGVDDHAWGELALGSDGSLALLAYYGGELVAPTGMKFRTLDPSSWQPGSAVYLDMLGEAPFGIATRGNGGGYVASWRQVEADGTARPVVATLDSAGGVIAGPTRVAPDATYPGRSADVASTSVADLVATSNATCDAGDPLCVARSVRIWGLSANGGSLEARATIGALSAASSPGRPLLATYGDLVFAAWSEGDSADATKPRTVRLARLAPDGSLIDTRTLADGVSIGASPSLSAGLLGVFVAWGKPSDPTLPPTQVGSASIELHHLALDGEEVQPPIVVPTTAIESLGRGTIAQLVVATKPPRPSVLVTWSGEATTPGTNRGAWLARLDCPIK